MIVNVRTWLFFEFHTPSKTVSLHGIIIPRNHEKCGVQLFSQNTKLSITHQGCKITLSKYIFSESTLLELQNPVFEFFIRLMVQFLCGLNLRLKFSGIEYVRGIPAGFLKGKYGSPRQTEIGPEINKKWFSDENFFLKTFLKLF